MVSPYLLRRVRSLEEALSDRLRQGRPAPDGLVDRERQRREAEARAEDAASNLRLIVRRTIPT